MKQEMSFFNVFEGLSDERYLFLRKALSDFIYQETADAAELVYTYYMELYRTKDSEGNMLLDLIDIMKNYEANASVFTEKQRDHYIHSVNVFILGLKMYVSNRSIREKFSMRYGKGTFDSEIECFIFLWGNASLFHDIGYPMEIAFNQAKYFARSIASIYRNGAKTSISMEIIPYKDLTEVDLNKWGTLTEDLIELLSENISEALSKDSEDTKEIVESYPALMSENYFVDHGFFSSLICLRSYAYSLQNSENDKKRFYGEVVTVASAICMHNMFPHTFVERHGYESLKLDRHPLAFLLILCDELQEWNRKGYGAHMTETFWPRESLVDVTDTRLRVNYRVEWGEYGQEFAEDKKKNLQTYLDTVSAFPEGIAISCSSNNSAAYLEMKLRNGTGSITPRPIIDNIIALARKIHENYNRQRQIDNPQAKLEYPQWDELSQDLKYSNMSQALSMNKTLNACGYVITKTDTGVDKFPPEDVETMSILEHDRWVTERISNGWVYGPEKNVELRTSPYIVPWEDLKENIRELDRQAIRNIPGLLKEIGLGAVKKY